MADYVILINYTQKGVEGIKQSPARLDKARETFAARSALTNASTARHSSVRASGSRPRGLGVP